MSGCTMLDDLLVLQHRMTAGEVVEQLAILNLMVSVSDRALVDLVGLIATIQRLTGSRRLCTAGCIGLL